MSTETVKLNFFNKEHVFHITPNDLPLPEDGIIGLKFFSKYDRYAITPNFLVLDQMKLPLQVDGDFIPAKTSKIFRIPSTVNTSPNLTYQDLIKTMEEATRGDHIQSPRENPGRNGKYQKETRRKYN